MFVASLKAFSLMTASIIQYGCVTHCFLEYIAELNICSGPSMEPTLSSNDILISERITSRINKYKHGDIIVTKSPRKPNEYLCKRITGLPGDRIQYKDLKHVPIGHVWVEGDNDDDSMDSRIFGPIPQGLIRSRVFCRIWPLRDFGMLTVNSY